jgi:lysophospholipase L1-like esterase
VWLVFPGVRAVKTRVLVATVAVLWAGSWAPAAASGSGASVLAWRSAVPASYYLALGDSVAVATGTSSYPYLVHANYQRKLPGLRLYDIAVPGATTSSMLDGQYANALGFLHAHRRHLALITIDIGGNDAAGCFGPGGVNAGCLSQAQAMIKHNLDTMLTGLRKAASGVPVIGMNYYNPFLGYWLAEGPFRSFALSTVSAGVALNRELTALYGGAKKTADVQGAFRSTDLTTVVHSQWGDVPIAVKRACSWLDIQCHPGAPEGFGLDPNAGGEVAIASAFERAIGPLCAPRRSVAHGRCRRV